MSQVLQQNMYGLQHPGASIEEIESLDSSLYALIRYSCSINRLIRDLFGVRVEVTGATCYLLLSGGVTLMPSPELCLPGCHEDGVLAVFGPR